MSVPTAAILTPQAGDTSSFGPATLENRTAQAGFTDLGVWFMNFSEDGHADPWTLQYEETVYVIAGEASLIIGEGDRLHSITATADQIVSLPRGTTVQYGGRTGTRLLLSMAPANWRDRA